MLIHHDKAKFILEGWAVKLEQGVCTTHFKSENGVVGNLFIQRWISHNPINKFSFLRYGCFVCFDHSCDEIIARLSASSTGSVLKVGSDLKKIETVMHIPTVEQSGLIREILSDLSRQFDVFSVVFEGEEKQFKKHADEVRLSMTRQNINLIT